MTESESTPSIRDVFRGRLRYFREALLIERSELAYRVGKSPQWIAKIEAGNQSVTLENAQALADALGIPLVEFLTTFDELREPSDSVDEAIAAMLESLSAMQEKVRQMMVRQDSFMQSRGYDSGHPDGSGYSAREVLEVEKKGRRK